MGTSRTGFQIDNKTPFAIEWASISFNLDSYEENLFEALFTSPLSKTEGRWMTVSGDLNLAPGAFADNYIEVINYGEGRPMRVTLRLSNKQEISFEAHQLDAFETIDSPKWVPVIYAGLGILAPIPAAIGVTCWTRHDSGITGKYEYGLLTFTIADNTATARWMSANPHLASRPLNEITLPGTHDTGTWGLSGNAQCQTMPLRQQLDMGIRFVDIRVEYFSASGTDDMYVYHGLVATDVRFEAGVIPICESFLDQNPGETIVMMVSRNKYFVDGLLEFLAEWGLASSGLPPVAADDLFAQCMQRILDRHRRSFLIRSTVPTLFEAQNKIVLATRYEKGTGLSFYPSWPDDASASFTAGGVTVDVQDVYQFGGLSGLAAKVDNKWVAVKGQLDKTVKAGNPATGNWFINYCSASGVPGTLDPVDFAKGWASTQGINDRLLAYLKAMPNPHQYLGTVMMDFPEYPEPGELIRRLIEANRKP